MGKDQDRPRWEEKVQKKNYRREKDSLVLLSMTLSSRLTFPWLIFSLILWLDRNFLIFQHDYFFFSGCSWTFLPDSSPQTPLICFFTPARHQPLINLSASPASKNFLQEPHTAHAAHKAAAGIKQVPSQIKASIDNTGVALQIKGSASPWEPLRIAFQMVTLTARQAAWSVTGLSLPRFDHWNWRIKAVLPGFHY